MGLQHQRPVAAPQRLLLRLLLQQRVGLSSSSSSSSTTTTTTTTAKQLLYRPNVLVQPILQLLCSELSDPPDLLSDMWWLPGARQPGLGELVRGPGRGHAGGDQTCV